MNEPFNIPVIYKGEELEFKARLERWAFGFRFVVLIDEITVTFEPDDEGNYRALGDKPVEIGLLRVLADKLAELSNSAV